MSERWRTPWSDLDERLWPDEAHGYDPDLLVAKGRRDPHDEVHAPVHRADERIDEELEAA